MLFDPFESTKLADYCRNNLAMSERHLGNEYYYQSLPLCIIDAVFSIGVLYNGVEAVVRRYCDFFKLQKNRDDRSRNLPSPDEQESVAQFCKRFEEIGIERMTSEVFQNRQRTSTRSGILKSDAVQRFARVLHHHGIDYLQDVAIALESKVIAADIAESLVKRAASL